MVLSQINQILVELASLFFTGYEKEMISLVIYTLGMALYGIIIWNYYRHLAKRDLFILSFEKYEQMHGGIVVVKKILSVFFYIIRYVVIFPLYTFMWFSLLSFFLFFLAKTQTVDGILLISITIVSAVRITSYYSEDLSRDLAKMIPFALLGIFVVDPTFFSANLIYERFLEIPTLKDLVMRYLIFVILLEFCLRSVHGLVTYLKEMFKNKLKEKPKEGKTKNKLPPGVVPLTEEDVKKAI